MLSKTPRYLLAISMIVFLSTASAENLWDKLKKAAKEADDKSSDKTSHTTPQVTGLSMLDPKTQNCDGRWGLGCGAVDDLTNPTYVEWPCSGDDNLVCVTSKMSIGAIKHDMCCNAEKAKGKTGHHCSLLKQFTFKKIAPCEAEWDQAKFEFFGNDKFDHTWQYRVGDDQESANWWLGMVPDGIKVSQKDPESDRIFCHSNKVAEVSGEWVCGESPESVTPEPTELANEDTSDDDQPETTTPQTSSASGIYCLSGVCVGQRVSELNLSLDWEVKMGGSVFGERNTKNLYGISDAERKFLWSFYPPVDDARGFIKVLGKVDTMCLRDWRHTMNIGFALPDTSVGLGVLPAKDGGWQGYQVRSIRKKYVVPLSRSEEWINTVKSKYPEDPSGNISVGYGISETGGRAELSLTDTRFGKLSVDAKERLLHPGCQPKNTEEFKFD